MNKLGVKDISINNIVITLSDAENVVINFNGNIDMMYPTQIFEPFFNDIQNKIISNNLKEIYCDVRNLKFINSGGIKCFVTWIIKMSKLPVENRYTIIFIIDKNSSWQSFSFKVLKDIEPVYVKLNENF